MSKKTWILIASLVLSLTLGLGGSLAYLTDTDTKVNTFTMGDVEIKVEEELGQQYDGMMPGVTVDKVAMIENTGSNNAYVWMTVAIPQELEKYIELEWRADDDKGAWLGDNPDVGAVNRYELRDEAGRAYVVETYVWFEAIGNGEKTDNLLKGVKLNEYVNIVDGQYYFMGWNDQGDKVMEPIPSFDGMEIIVTGHAIQSEGFESTGWEGAYKAYMGQWEGALRVENNPKSEGKTYTSSATVNEYIVLPDDDENSDCITASGEDTVVVINGGMYDIGTNFNPCAVWAKDGATVEIHGGEFWCDARETVNANDHIDLIYAGASNGGNPTKGTILIYGGRFGAEGSTPENPGAWLLNEKDGYGEIIVYGGDFLNWNPAGNTSEGNPTNFVADGQVVWMETNEENNEVWYHVRNDNEDEENNAIENGWEKL